jgi:hypothetical protein
VHWKSAWNSSWAIIRGVAPDVQTFFRTYNNFSENTVVFQIQFLMSWEWPEFPWKSSANLLKFTLKCTGNLPEIPHEQLSGVLHPPPPPPPSEFQANTLWFIVHVFHLPKYCASYSRAFCCCHAIARFKFMNFYYIKYSVL